MHPAKSHRRTQSNSSLPLLSSLPLHLPYSLPSSHLPPPPSSFPEKQIIIETLDLSPQDQLKLAGVPGYGGNKGLFKFSGRRELPKFMELMKMGGEKSEDAKNSENVSRINEESMENVSEISKKSSATFSAVRDLFKSGNISLNIMDEIQKMLKSDGKERIKKGHSKSCFWGNIGTKIRVILQHTASISIQRQKKDSHFWNSCSHSKVSSLNMNGSSLTLNGKKIRKRSDECLLNKIESNWLGKHKKTLTTFKTELTFKEIIVKKINNLEEMNKGFDKVIKEKISEVKILKI